ncbi:MAG: 3-methyl-2-oxobutanoate dehydrogenase subunit VorB [Candidatus Eisenbacteria bacterium]|nr:3-methyl-2-oxobutanoate dehydrogenase subunit VorB [Candidatus Latescibacterota bacterium]MBD3303282.1 3-methyl-2-oxobutanoate dehydrogenase subunit VorB [Candidatus Eisenbacteria bacterium]
MAKQLLKGNDAVVKGAILAGCRAYYGYPITPASEIAEAAALYFPRVGGTFLQAESEIGAINMVYGASSAGIRSMTASSSPGISLKMEGVSYLVGAELPCVIVDIVRGGPGLGNIAPEQGDYFQIVKGGGHGNYRVPVLAPNSVQEMCDLTMLGFEIADRYRTPVFIMADGFTGQMMEPCEFPEPREDVPDKPWAVGPDASRIDNLVSSIYLDPDDLEGHVEKLRKKAEEIETNETRFEEYRLDDAEHVVIGYGIVSRILKSAVDMAREQGIKVGLLRPISLFPFPKAPIRKLAERVRDFLVVELSTGQMVEDVRLTLEGARPVRFYGRTGGNVPKDSELFEQIRKLQEEKIHA